MLYLYGSGNKIKKKVKKMKLFKLNEKYKKLIYFLLVIF